MKFQIVQNWSRQFYWRLVAKNALIIAVGVESHGTRAECRRAIDYVISAGESQFQVYEDFQRVWRWRLSSANGQVVAISGETYVTRQEALASAALTVGADADTPTEILHDSGMMRAVRPLDFTSK